MARFVHWTQDPNFCHLRHPPVWYNLEPGPYYTPAPSARMEKRLAEERQAQWRWNEVQSADSIITEPCVTALFCPCGVYGRTWARVRAALAGQDAENIPDPGLINSDCAEFVACFPLYGCLVGRLQATVRSFYGIEGTTSADWRDGWCCPCVTLERNEHEVIIRERQHRSLTKLHATESESHEQYQPESPMSYIGSAKSIPGDVKEQPKENTTPAAITCSAPTIQKDNAIEAQQSLDSGQACGVIIQPEHALTTDHMQSLEATVSDHTLEHDRASTLDTSIQVTSHGLLNEARLTVSTPPPVRSHDITQDTVL